MTLRTSNTSLRQSLPGFPLVLVVLGLLEAAAPAQVLLHEEFNDNSAGWTLEATWQIGPAVSAAGCAEPGSDADGRPGGGVAGNSIGNCSLPAASGYLVSPAVDATGASQLRLEFDRCLEFHGVFGGDAGATLDVWNGASWVNLLTLTNAYFQSNWTHYAYDITPWANPALKVRFGLWNNYGLTMAGWSVDNVRITNGEFFYDRFRDNAAGWTLGAEWQIGAATASIGCATDVGFYDDPASDADGTPGGGLAGAVIGGCVGGPAHAPYYLVSPPIDTTAAQTLHLQFDRWLNSDYVPYQNSTVEVYDGASWVTIFGSTSTQADSAWVRMTYNVTPYKNSAFRVRFGFDNSAAAYDAGGWNIDNVSVFDASGCSLAFCAYQGPGSIRVAARCYTNTVPAGTTLFNCITLHAGSFPNGLFFGIDPSFPAEVVPELVSGGLPFVGVSGPFGAVTWDLPQGVPAGITLYGVTLAISPGGFILRASPPTTFTTL